MAILFENTMSFDDIYIECLYLFELIKPKIGPTTLNFINTLLSLSSEYDTNEHARAGLLSCRETLKCINNNEYVVFDYTK